MVFLKNTKHSKDLEIQNRLLDSKKYFDMQEGKKVVGTFPLSWKKSFESGVIIPSKTRDCESLYR